MSETSTLIILSSVTSKTSKNFLFFLSRYQHDTDKTLTQMRFIDNHNNPIGVINWFAVHPTSMNNTNKLVSSDNVGYAALLLEKEMNPDNLSGKVSGTNQKGNENSELIECSPLQGAFVGAFASANLGDVSPNIMGPRCEYSGKFCDLHKSFCPPHEGQCIASGPGRDQFDSCRIIANRLYKGALGLLQNSVGREISGPIRYIHQFIDMSRSKATFFNPKTQENDEVSMIVEKYSASNISCCRLFYRHLGPRMFTCNGLFIRSRHNRWSRCI